MCLRLLSFFVALVTCNGIDLAAQDLSWLKQTQVFVRTLGSDDAAQAIVFAQLAALCIDQDQPACADSFYTLAFDAAQRADAPKIEAHIYRNYLAGEMRYNSAKARRAIADLEQLGIEQQNLEWQSDAHRATVHLLNIEKRVQEAFLEARYAYYLDVRAQAPPARMLDAWLILGHSQEAIGDKEEAYRSLLSARTAAVDAEDLLGEARVCGSLARFHSNIDDNEKAKVYWKKQRNLQQKARADSIALMTTENNLASTLFDLDDWDGGSQTIHRVIRFAYRTRNLELLDNAFTVLRSQYINRGRITELRELYTRIYPLEFRRIAVEQPYLHHRLLGYFAELDSNTEVAEHWYLSAERLFPAANNFKNQRVRFQQRVGEFFLRHRDYAKAREHLLKAYNEAETSDYLPFIASTARLLDSLARLEGAYDQAYFYARRAEQSLRQHETSAGKDKILQLELENERERREIEEQRNKEATVHRHNLQFTGIAVAIIIAFIGLLLLRSAHVSTRTLRIISFLSFILLFEFIILLADLFFHFLTHGEPWQMILIKLVFIAGLSQVHHWLEHKLAHYLAQHEPLTELRRRVKSWWQKGPQHQTSTAPVVHKPVDPTESTDEIF
jgi:tetratricopeptide (TPR) repeat protein